MSIVQLMINAAKAVGSIIYNDFLEEQKLTASDADSGDVFGHSVSISNDGSRVIVSAWGDDGDPGDFRGAAYVFSRSGTTWTQEQKLTASDAQSFDAFGNGEVSISGDGTRVIVGAYLEDGGAGNGANLGAAYVFSRSGTTWTQEQKLTASDADLSDEFGISAAISDDGSRAIVGAWGEDGAGSLRGAAYVFSRSGTTWTQEQKLTASDTQDDDRFGYSVAISDDGTRCIVGAYREDGGAGNPLSDAGAAYVFSRSGTTWTEEQKLTASDAQASDEFGYSVAISDDGTRCIVGAYLEDGGAGDPISGAGAAYVFSRSGTTWTEEQKLTLSAQGSDYFGFSVAMSDDGTRVIVGALYEDGGAGDPLLNAGAAYVFSRSGTTWTEKQKLTASDAQTQDLFGYSVAISSDGTRCIVGSRDEDGGAGDPISNAGAAYVFST